jgi:hypothetical protein
MNSGYIYCLSNLSFKGVYKIGYTNRSPKERSDELSGHTSIPHPFKIEFCKKVNDSRNKETIIHNNLYKYRVNINREFFEVDLKIIKQQFENSEGEWCDIYGNLNIENEEINNSLSSSISNLNINSSSSSVSNLNINSSSSSVSNLNINSSSLVNKTPKQLLSEMINSPLLKIIQLIYPEENGIIVEEKWIQLYKKLEIDFGKDRKNLIKRLEREIYDDNILNSFEEIKNEILKLMEFEYIAFQCMKSGQRVRHKLNDNEIWIGSIIRVYYDVRILYNNQEYTTESFPEKHNLQSKNGRKKGKNNWWHQCEIELENGKWMSVKDYADNSWEIRCNCKFHDLIYNRIYYLKTICLPFPKFKDGQKISYSKWNETIIGIYDDINKCIIHDNKSYKSIYEFMIKGEKLICIEKSKNEKKDDPCHWSWKSKSDHLDERNFFHVNSWYDEIKYEVNDNIFDYLINFK